MRIYCNAYELMSEMGRNLYEMGLENRPKTYQNKDIEGDENFVTKELICEQYCLTSIPDVDNLFIHTHSRDWAEAEFKERLDENGINPGRAWELRKEVWEEFLVDTPIVGKKFDYSYGERMNEKFITTFGKGNDRFTPFGKSYRTSLDLIISLLKYDPDTRKAILPIYSDMDTAFLDGSRRIPCSMYYDFLIRTNPRGEKQLNICYHQRSSDFIMHFGNDVFLAWRLMEYIAEQVGVKPGYLYHTIDSLHTYKRDWDKLKTSLTELR